ncbi:MAG: SpoIID/LytB domain-containing protein, partial [Myxococcota bacterium]
MLTLLLMMAVQSAEPAPIPTGMELLYGDRVPVRPDGEPSIAVGIMQGKRRVTLEVTAGQLDFYQDGVLRSARPRPGAMLRVSILESKAAARRWFVDVHGVSFSDHEGLERAAQDWTQRGYEVEVLEIGAAMGIGGQMIDTRALRLVLPASNRAAAQRLAQNVHRETGVRAFVSSRLETQPWAELRVDIDGAPIGIATSYIRLTADPDRTLTVRDVEFGKGFSHSGTEDRTYRGELYVVVDADGELAVVNVLGAEDLLRGVVPSELFASAHPDALAAQSVAARNQLFAKLGHRHHSEPFHLCDEQHCQVYTGVNREDPRTNRAIAKTRGQLLFHQGRLVDTVYSSTCGGHTEHNDAVWGNVADPALRGRPDFDLESHPELASFEDGLTPGNIEQWVSRKPVTYCSSASKAAASKFRWSKTLSSKQVDTLVAKRFSDVGHVRGLEVKSRGPGGRVKVLEIIGSRGRAQLLHELPIRRIIGHLNSGAFEVERS